MRHKFIGALLLFVTFWAVSSVMLWLIGNQDDERTPFIYVASVCALVIAALAAVTVLLYFGLRFLLM